MNAKVYLTKYNRVSRAKKKRRWNDLIIVELIVVDI